MALKQNDFQDLAQLDDDEELNQRMQQFAIGQTAAQELKDKKTSAPASAADSTTKLNGQAKDKEQQQHQQLVKKYAEMEHSHPDGAHDGWYSEDQEVIEVASTRESKIKYLNPLVWIDLEMTGLDKENDLIMEIAVILSDQNLKNAIEGPELAISLNDKELNAMNDWCKTTHGNSGLTERCRVSEISVQDAEQQVLDFIESQDIQPKTAMLAGNSVHVDKDFMLRQMPRLMDYLSPKIIDVSTVYEFGIRMRRNIIRKEPRKVMAHTALADIRGSVQQLTFYKDELFLSLGDLMNRRSKKVSKAIATTDVGCKLDDDIASITTRLQFPILWLNCTRTGDDPNVDQILQIACILTDGWLTQAFEGPNITIHRSEEDLPSMSDEIRQRLDESGVLKAVKESKTTLEEAQNQLEAFCDKYISFKPIMAGIDAHVNKQFVYREFRGLYNAMHYRLMDVTVLTELLRLWYPQAQQKSASLWKVGYECMSDTWAAIQLCRQIEKQYLQYQS